MNEVTGSSCRGPVRSFSMRRCPDLTNTSLDVERVRDELYASRSEATLGGASCRG